MLLYAGSTSFSATTVLDSLLSGLLAVGFQLDRTLLIELITGQDAANSRIAEIYRSDGNNQMTG